MIIFGTRGVTYSAGNGHFHCPSCRAKVPYGHKRVRRFFTLYFIPVIPLDMLGEYIECRQCRDTYRTEVLDYDPEAGAAEFEAEFHRAVKRVMVNMMLADGEVRDDEVEMIRNIYAQLTGNEISEQDVQLEIGQARAAGASVAGSLEPIAGNLNDHGKEIVVKAAFMIAAADGEFHDREKALLAQIGQSLGMTAAHLKGVIRSMLEEE